LCPGPRRFEKPVLLLGLLAIWLKAFLEGAAAVVRWALLILVRDLKDL
jgi:hypothetical protein